jgi:hypothetical protein
MRGTVREKKASDQRSPFVLNIRNWMYHAPYATSSAKRIRPAREFGVVRGSEIMKKVKSSSAPLCRRCSGITSGSPSHSERPKTSDM